MQEYVQRYNTQTYKCNLIFYSLLSPNIWQQHEGRKVLLQSLFSETLVQSNWLQCFWAMVRQNTMVAGTSERGSCLHHVSQQGKVLRQGLGPESVFRGTSTPEAYFFQLSPTPKVSRTSHTSAPQMETEHSTYDTITLQRGPKMVIVKDAFSPSPEMLWNLSIFNTIQRHKFKVSTETQGKLLVMSLCKKRGKLHIPIQNGRAGIHSLDGKNWVNQETPDQSKTRNLKGKH